MYSETDDVIRALAENAEGANAITQAAIVMDRLGKCGKPARLRTRGMFQLICCPCECIIFDTARCACGSGRAGIGRPGHDLCGHFGTFRWRNRMNHGFAGAITHRGGVPGKAPRSDQPRKSDRMFCGA